MIAVIGDPWQDLYREAQASLSCGAHQLPINALTCYLFWDLLQMFSVLLD